MLGKNLMIGETPNAKRADGQAISTPLAFKVSALVARVTPSSQMVCVMVPAPAVPSMSIVSLVLVALTPA